MSTTLEFPGYRKESFNPEVPVRLGEASVTAKLSPFHIPSHIGVEVDRNGTCRVIFDYLNEEPSEKKLRSLPGDSAVLMKVGKHSRKLMEVHFRDAVPRLEKHGKLTFEPNRVFIWSKELPAHRQFACNLNAVAISKILALMPPSLLKSIRRSVAR